VDENYCWHVPVGDTKTVQVVVMGGATSAAYLYGLGNVDAVAYYNWGYTHLYFSFFEAPQMDTEDW
jgi:hypothetical protein